jgi:hypothetical protein
MTFKSCDKVTKVVDVAPISPSQYPDHLATYLQETHGPTGRFDQKPLSNNFPPPSGINDEDALMIIVNMQASAFEDHSLINSILPNAEGVYAPTAMGTPWCEFENAAMIREMSLIARMGTEEGMDKNVRKNLFANMSRTLNLKYGIDRSEASCKNQWYRELRARSGIDERASFRTSKDATRLSDNLRVSLNSKSKSKTSPGRVTKANKSTAKSKAFKGAQEKAVMMMAH